MKKIAYLSFVALLGSATLVSCSDFLDTQNKSNATNADDYLKDNLESTQANAYYQLKALSNNFEINCWGTDLYIPVRGKDPGDLDRFATTAENSDVSSYYKNNYLLVQYACLYADKAGQGSKGEAEGHFLKDLAYYNLTQQFGGVPYIDHYVTDASRNYPRMGLDSLYNTLESDLETIYNENVLDATNHNGYASNQAVAALLSKIYLAHGWDCNTSLVDAEAGTYSVKSTDKFQKAAEWAVKAIDGMQLTQTFEQKWSPSNEGNNEQIFSIQYDRAGYPGNVASNGHGLQNQFGNYYGDPTKTGLKYSGSVGQQSAKALRLWNEGDSRWDGTFMNTIYNWDGNSNSWPNTGYYAYYNNKRLDTLAIAYRYYPWYMTQSEIEADLREHKAQYVKGNYVNTPLAFVLDDQNGAQYTFNASTGAATRSAMTYNNIQNVVYGGNTVKKFDDPTSSQANSSTQDYRDVVVLDLSDIYLVAAEAYYMSGNEPEALNYINAVRNRAGAEAITSFAEYQSMVHYTRPTSFGSVTPIDCILDERARELYGQEMRYVDLRRTKQLVRYNLAFNSTYVSSVSEMTGTDGNIKWLRPIPQEAINNNNSLTQNPGY